MTDDGIRLAKRVAEAVPCSRGEAERYIAGGWVTVDVTHACFASEKYCRIAVGRDYETAAPVRGTRVGGMAETLDVSVQVSAQQ